MNSHSLGRGRGEELKLVPCRGGTPTGSASGLHGGAMFQAQQKQLKGELHSVQVRSTSLASVCEDTKNEAYKPREPAQSLKNSSQFSHFMYLNVHWHIGRERNC